MKPLEPWVERAIREALPGRDLLDKPIPRCPRCNYWPTPGDELVGGSYVVCRRCKKIFNR